MHGKRDLNTIISFRVCYERHTQMNRRNVLNIPCKAKASSRSAGRSVDGYIPAEYQGCIREALMRRTRCGGSMRCKIASFNKTFKE